MAKPSLTTQLRQRADTLENYLRARPLDPDLSFALGADGVNVTVGELRDLVRLLRDAAARLSPSTLDPIEQARPGIAYEVTQRVLDDALPSTSQ